MKKTALLLFFVLAIPVLAWAQSITVTNPVSGQQYCMFKQQWIYWEKSGAMANTVNIFFMHPNGQSVIRTIATNAPNNGHYRWDGAASNPGSYMYTFAGPGKYDFRNQ
ncbi:MAG: hypothetical protein GY850_16645 [bacterium]|nr:hypothetical protein [bacterium]